MSDAKNEDFVDVQEIIETNDSEDEDYEDALDELVRASDAAKGKKSEPFQAGPKSESLASNLEQLKVTESGDSNVNEKDSNNKSDKDFDVTDALNDEGDSEPEEDQENEEDLLEQRKKREEAMNEEEIMKLKTESQTAKEEGNSLFRNGDYTGAIQSYTKALEVCPLKFTKDRSIMYSNRAACMMHLDDNTAGIEDCTKAIDLNPNYLKAILRRAELYEKTEKLDEALADYQKVLEMDPMMHHAREACLRLPKQIEARNEKMKEEMMGKLKDLGNLILRPFGLSTDNFNLQQDPNTGGYSVNFQQNNPQPRQPPEPTYFPPEDPPGDNAASTPSSGNSENTEAS